MRLKRILDTVPLFFFICIRFLFSIRLLFLYKQNFLLRLFVWRLLFHFYGRVTDFLCVSKSIEVFEDFSSALVNIHSHIFRFVPPDFCRFLFVHHVPHGLHLLPFRCFHFEPSGSQLRDKQHWKLFSVFVLDSVEFPVV